MPESEPASHTEYTILMILFSMDGILLLLNLLFAVYISIFYFFRLKVKGAFILLFYIFVDLTTIARISEITFIVMNLYAHRHIDFYEDLHKTTTVEYSRSIAMLTFLGLCIVVIATMFQIAVSLQVLSMEIDPLTAKRRQAIFYISVSVLMLVATFLEIWIHIVSDNTNEEILKNWKNQN